MAAADRLTTWRPPSPVGGCWPHWPSCSATRAARAAGRQFSITGARRAKELGVPTTSIPFWTLALERLPVFP